MRKISCKDISEAISTLCISACVHLPSDVLCAFDACKKVEDSDTAVQIFDIMKKNSDLAKSANIPVCQDTGMAVVFLDIGQEVQLTDGDLYTAVNDGVAKGYTEGGLRLSVVSDPFRRVNTNTNTPAVIHTRIVPGDGLKITVAPKGFGSENMSKIKLFNPTATPDDVIDFIVSVVRDAGANPCPPVVVGVGIGGDFELCAILAKRALLIDLTQDNPDEFYRDMEHNALQKINALNIGPQGLGGKTTALSVKIIPHPTHIAGLPCAVNIGCHISRHAEVLL